jgi:hypothetical protein
VILLLEHARQAGLPLADTAHAMAAVALVLEILAPIILQRALIWARETPEQQNGP